MIGIIDYGMGNIQSVQNAFERLGSPVRIVTSGRELAACDGLVLPGVGAFSKAMDNLRANDLVGPLKEQVASGKPLLGICLGLQLLADASEEFGVHEGLGLIPGRVRLIPVGAEFRLPHIGWNGVSIRAQSGQGLFAGIEDASAFYFVHSFMLECDPAYVTATTNHGCEVVAAVQRGNVYAAQFHPEKSQTNGLRVLKNFVQQVRALKEEASHA
jgi:glutamine amidotransferase